MRTEQEAKQWVEVHRDELIESLRNCDEVPIFSKAPVFQVLTKRPARAMEKIKFTIDERFLNMASGDCLYTAEAKGDQSGEYVRAEVAEELLAALKAIVSPGGRENAMQIAVPVIEKFSK